MAFAIASGVKPEQGIFTAIIAGFLISALGGSSVQIGGPAGAFIVIVYGIVQRYGVANLLIATVLAGVLLLALGWLKLGALVRYIPVSIVIGFTNGIAVLIALSQAEGPARPQDRQGAGRFLRAERTRSRSTRATSTRRRSALGVACFVGLLFVVAPGRGAVDLVGARRAPWHQRASRLGASATPSCASPAASPGRSSPWSRSRCSPRWLQLPVETIGTRFGGIPRALPAFVWPDFDWATVQRLFVPTVTIALLGAVESLLCARVADGMIAEHATTRTRS